MLEQALQSKITVVLVRVLAILLGCGALVHVGNIAGMSGRPWGSTPLVWQVMDIVLLGFNLVVGVGLWLKQPWAVVAFIVGIVTLQLIPYTVFRQHFIETAEHAAMLNGMVVFWVTILLLLSAVIWWRGSAG